MKTHFAFFVFVPNEKYKKMHKGRFVPYGFVLKEFEPNSLIQRGFERLLS